MRALPVLPALRALAFALALTTLLCNWPFFGKYYERVGHIYVKHTLWACLGAVRIWTICAMGYFGYILSPRSRRPSAHTDVATLACFGVVGCTLSGAACGAGFFSVWQCAGYDSSCARALVGGTLMWIMSIYFLAFSVFRLRNAVSWRGDSCMRLDGAHNFELAPLTSILEDTDESDTTDGTFGASPGPATKGYADDVDTDTDSEVDWGASDNDAEADKFADPSVPSFQATHNYADSLV